MRGKGEERPGAPPSPAAIMATDAAYSSDEHSTATTS